jgi:hypothetical protein
MKKRRSIWIPPAQTTLRQLAELNRQVSYFKRRSESIRSYRPPVESIFFKKLVDYQSKLASIRNKIVHNNIEIDHLHPQSQFLDWLPTKEFDLVTRYQQIEELVSTGIERLAVGNKSGLKERFQSLEADLMFHHGEDLYIVEVKTPKEITDAKSMILESVQSRIREHLHQLQKEVGIRIFRLRLGLAIDRRARFRTIVHFIFKNLDDYDSEDYVVRAA